MANRRVSLSLVKLPPDLRQRRMEPVAHRSRALELNQQRLQRAGWTSAIDNETLYLEKDEAGSFELLVQIIVPDSNYAPPSAFLTSRRKDRPRMYRFLPLLLAFTLLTPAAHAQTPNEQLLFVLANQSRAEHNLPPLTWDPALARAAHVHLVFMTRQGGPAEHLYPGEPDLLTRGSQAGAHFSSIAENVAGSHPSAISIHEAWMNSPGHRANLLAAQLTTVGIAVAATPTGLYAVEDFCRPSSSTTSSAEKQVQQLLTARGIQPDASDQRKQDARASCGSEAQPQTNPTLIIQWESGDFTQLPPQLSQRLQPSNPQQPHTAAVASCPPQKPTPGFTTYRIAVLIY
jgi:uncharacterized protein YkwD